MAERTPIALTIAGSDSSGGAGIQADLKTFSAFGVYGASVVTAVTAQSTRGVRAVHEVPADLVREQIRAVLEDLEVGAVKTGMLAGRAIVLAVADEIDRHPALPLVVDPVMVATSGDPLLDPGAVDALRGRLLPRADLLTPNLAEAAVLSGLAPAAGEAEMVEQGRALLRLGSRAVLVKGGHAAKGPAVDILLIGDEFVRLEAPRVATANTHGTGCTLSAAIAALLARGEPLAAAVRRAKRYVMLALEHGRDLGVGQGRGPVDHLFAIKKAPPPT